MRLLRPFTLAVPALVCALAPVAHADEYVDRVNGLYAQIRPEHRSDLIILPAIAKMQGPPAAVAKVEQAMLLPFGAAAWSAAEEWVNAQPQRAVLAAVTDSVKNTQMAFGQPYGADALAATPEGIQLIADGLYSELGDPPMLAAVRFLYKDKLEQVASLVNVEATRLAHEGKPDEAIKVLGDWLFFSRQLADREFFIESQWGMRSMVAALERIRDIAYEDVRSAKPAITIEQIMAVLDRIKTDDGYLMGDKLTFPMGNRIAADQVVAVTFINRAGINPATFGNTMARMASSTKPLRLFSEAARWDEVGRTHANFFQTGDQVKAVYDDWTARWPLGPFDTRQGNVPDYERTDAAKFAVVKTVIPDMGVLFNLRQVLRAQLVGTRNALGVVAFHLRNKNFPPTLASIRPVFVKVIEADPFNPNRDAGAQPFMQYFVPIRDQPRNEREDPRPHEVNVVIGGDVENFQMRIGDDRFILYSVGPDFKKDWAKNVSGEPARGAIGDLLIWPPVTSLLRQRLLETNRLQ
jgi:hypothetical protein